MNFDGPDGDILGVYRILKPPQTKKSPSRPAWRLIGKSTTGGFGFTNSVHFNRVPTWVQNKIVEFKSQTVVESVYRLKGRKFRYKIVFDYKGQGCWLRKFTEGRCWLRDDIWEVYRRPRTWFWKTLKVAKSPDATKASSVFRDGDGNSIKFPGTLGSETKSVGSLS